MASVARPLPDACGKDPASLCALVEQWTDLSLEVHHPAFADIAPARLLDRAEEAEPERRPMPDVPKQPCPTLFARRRLSRNEPKNLGVVQSRKRSSKSLIKGGRRRRRAVSMTGEELLLIAVLYRLTRPPGTPRARGSSRQISCSRTGRHFRLRPAPVRHSAPSPTGGPATAGGDFCARFQPYLEDVTGVKAAQKKHADRIVRIAAFRVQEEVFWGDDRLEDALRWAAKT